MPKKPYLELFLTFLKIGAFTFGGGYAMIPLIKREVVETKKWITEEEMLDVIAVAESTPGPLAINSATFVGSHLGGIFGALCATLGVVLPSFLIILAIFFTLNQVEHLAVVQYAFMGIRVGVVALIFTAFLSVFKKVKKEVFSYLLIVAAFAAVAIFKVSAVLVLIGCALTGCIWTFLIERSKAK